MKFSAPLLALVVSGCASRNEPFTIQGHDARDVVLLASKEIKTGTMRLPAGYYFPVAEDHGGLLAPQHRMAFAHPAGVMARDLVGMWAQFPGGIYMDCSPNPKAPYGFVKSPGFNWASGYLPAGAVKVLHRPLASSSPQAVFLRMQAEQYKRQQMYRDAQGAAVQGALMAIPR